jgi:hypothetical protein
MPALSNADLLTLWEHGYRLHSVDRGLLAIRALYSGSAEENVADWPLGRRNQALAELHRDCFGPELQGWTECDRCGEKLEFVLECRSLIERQRESRSEPVEVKGQMFRVPTSRDLARIAGERNAEKAALRLMEFCHITNGEDDAAAQSWSSEELEELGEKMIEADPLAETMLSFECPSCKSTRAQALDLPEFLWAEVEAAAKRLLEEIHNLASAYGWSEDAILSLSNSRRALYLQMVQA